MIVLLRCCYGSIVDLLMLGLLFLSNVAESLLLVLISMGFCTRLFLFCCPLGLLALVEPNQALLYLYISQIKQRMFNPKQALQRIRRTKYEKQQVQTITEGVQPLFSNPKASPPVANTDSNQNIQDRVSKLELMVLRLTDELSNSNQTVEKLKKQNSNLQTQILKLQYQNSQLKSNQMYSGFRRSGSNKKITQSISEEPERERQVEKDKGKKTQSHYISASRQSYSVEVEEIIEDIKNEPIQNVLKRRQYQFRARKPEQKQVAAGNKYLKQLAVLQKQYNKSMRKPVLVIKLDDADFQ